MALAQNFTYNNTVARDGDQQNFRIDHSWNEAKQRSIQLLPHHFQYGLFTNICRF
jgi:hypothetical protein